MRKLILNVALSLDAMMEGPNGEYDWCFTDQDYGMTDFIKRIDAIFYGRKSYELVQSMGQNPWAKLKSYVFSTTMRPGDGFEIVNDDVVSNVNRIKAEPGKDIWLFGGAQLTTGMLNAGLVDELLIAVHPIILGPGHAMFQDISNRINLRLLTSKTYDSGLVMLNYAVMN